MEHTTKILTAFSNEKRPPHTPETEGGIVVRDPHTLYNKISTNDTTINELLSIPWHLGYAEAIDYVIKRIGEIESNV